MTKLAGIALISIGVLAVLGVMIAASVTVMKTEDVFFMWGIVGIVVAAIGGFLYNS